MFKGLAKFLRTDPIYGPLTESKTRGNIKKPDIKVPPQRPKGGPPAPTPKFRAQKSASEKDIFAPKHAIECGWIEIYLVDPKSYGGYRAEKHHKVKFWIDSNDNLVVFKGMPHNQEVYHDYIKYITHNSEHWG